MRENVAALDRAPRLELGTRSQQDSGGREELEPLHVVRDLLPDI